MEFEDESFNIAQGHHFDEQSKDVPMCQEPCCQNPSIQCENDEYYCPEHAAENGYCCCCGTFIAGWRDFSDLCENCEDEVRENYDPDEGFYYNDPY